jgi:hypothetical protein
LWVAICTLILILKTANEKFPSTMNQWLKRVDIQDVSRLDVVSI